MFATIALNGAPVPILLQSDLPMNAMQAHVVCEHGLRKKLISTLGGKADINVYVIDGSYVPRADIPQRCGEFIV